jgi:hypothetical protein
VHLNRPADSKLSGTRLLESSGRPAFAPGSTFEAVAQGAVVAAFEAAFLALPFARLHQVLQATGPLHGGFTAFRAPVVPLHPQLVLALPRNRQPGEFILYRLSHLLLRQRPTSVLCSLTLYLTTPPRAPLNNELAEGHLPPAGAEITDSSDGAAGRLVFALET